MRITRGTQSRRRRFVSVDLNCQKPGMNGPDPAGRRKTGQPVAGHEDGVLRRVLRAPTGKHLDGVSAFAEKVAIVGLHRWKVNSKVAQESNIPAQSL